MRHRTSLLLFAFAIAASAQTPPVLPRAGETIEVSIVNVDTVVTDKHGARVHGLRKEDFEIYENGVKQPISNFAEYASERDATSAGAATPSATSPAPRAAQSPPAQRRTIIVFIERFQLPAFRSDPMFAAMKKLLHGTVRPGDRVSVVTWNHGILGARLDYTDNLALIDKTIDAVAVRTTTLDHDPMDDIEREVDSLTTWEAELADFGASKGIGVPDIPRESGLSFFVEENSRMSAKTALIDEQRKVQTINALMRSVGAADGKKILLLATHRLSEYAGAEALFMAGANTLPSDFRREFDGKPLIKSLIQTANANGFTIYPIYAEGLGATTSVSPQFKAVQPRNIGYDYLVLNNETPMLEYVAEQTGGVAAWGSKDVTNLLPHVVDDFESYYSLAFNATPANAASRRIEVKVKDPKLTVRARKQFLPKSDATKMEDRVIATLFGNPPPSSFDVKVRLANPKLDDKKNYITPITIEVPISALTMLPRDANSSAGAFTVYTAWGAVLGGISDTHHETKQFTIAAADIEKAKQNHFTYQFNVASSTPYLRIALGVYDEVSKEYALNLVDLEPPPKK
ncbi:MAG TPA: VWA domain-containing protein [Thermoanaerobaculia bacterium]|jgi:VWFA-related protein|nr:VWA domain-containing protein [Thermoanaerobaculia bacterium]